MCKKKGFCYIDHIAIKTCFRNFLPGPKHAGLYSYTEDGLRLVNTNFGRGEVALFIKSEIILED